MIGLYALVLAAGAASRYRAAGGPEASKLVAPFRGQPLVRVAVTTALAVGLPVIVVTGHARTEVEAALAGLKCGFVHNADFASGLASSLRAGVSALPASASGALALLGDMPLVSAGTLDRLAAAFAAHPEALAVIPVFSGRRGNPVLLSRGLFPAVAGLAGDQGARRLLKDLDPADLIELTLPDAAVALDVDTPDDLSAIG